MAEQLLDAGTHLLALGLKRLQFFRKPRVFGFQIIICLDGRVSLLPQLRHKIDGSKDALLQALERVYVFGSGGLLLPCSPAPGFLPTLLDVRSGRRSALRPFHQSAEPCFVCGGDFGQHLSVQVDTGLLQTVHELAVRNARRPASSIDADNPQRTEFALLVFAANVAMTERAFDRFLGGAVQLALVEKNPCASASVFLRFALRFVPRFTLGTFFSFSI